MTKFEIPILKKEYGNLPIAEWLLVKNIVGSCPYAVLVIEYLNLGFKKKWGPDKMSGPH
jgi:hypothetical protein